MRFIKDLTPLDQWGIGGTDLGFCFRLPHNDEWAWVWGDTFERHGVGGPGWRSPVLTRSTGQPRGSVPVRMTSAAGGRYAKQVFNYEHRQGQDGQISTVIPTDGISIGDRAYLGGAVMIHHFGNVGWSELQYSDDNGENFAHTGAIFRDPMMQQMSFDMDENGIVHALTSSFPRNADVQYYTVPAEDFTNPAKWTRRPHAGITRTIGEFGLRRIGDLWYLGFFEADDYRCSLRVAETVEGLTDPDFVTVQGVGWGQNDVPNARVAQLYGGYPFGVPGDIGVSVSHWNTETGWPYRALQYHVDEIKPVDGPVWDSVMYELRGGA